MSVLVDMQAIPSRVCVCGCRFDYHPQQYVAGVMEEDDPSHASRPLIGSPVDAGRSFTLYLYDREKHHVSRGWCSGCWVMCHVCVM
jgi:hypothetical protein